MDNSEELFPVVEPDGKVTPDPNELSGGRFWSPDEINASIGKGVLTPNFEKEWRMINGNS